MSADNTTTANNTTTSDKTERSVWKSIGIGAALGLVQGAAIYAGFKAAEWAVEKVLGGE